MLRILGLITLMLVLAACGGGDDGGESRTSATSTPGATATQPAAAPESTSEPTAEAAEPTATEAATEPAATATPAEPTATATTAATATPAPPTATATPEAGTADVVVGKWRIYQPQYSTASYIAGEVINQGDGDATQVEVVITLKDASGAILSSDSAFVDGFVRAGAKGAFLAIASDIDPATVATTDIIVQWDALEGSFFADYETDTFTVANVQWTADRIVGEVTNTGEDAATLVQITFIGYDEAGEVITVESTFAQLDTIQPGTMSPFEVNLYSGLPVPATWEVFVSGSKD